MRADSFKGVSIGVIRVDNRRKCCVVNLEKLQRKILGELKIWVTEKVAKFAEDYKKWWGITLFDVRIDPESCHLFIGDNKYPLPWDIVPLYEGAAWILEDCFGQKYITVLEAKVVLLTHATQLMEQHDNMGEHDHCSRTGERRDQVLAMAGLLLDRLEEIEVMGTA